MAPQLQVPIPGAEEGMAEQVLGIGFRGLGFRVWVLGIVILFLKDHRDPLIHSLQSTW